MTRSALRRFAVLILVIVGILLAGRARLRAGDNTWSGGAPAGAGLESAPLVAAAASSPYVVYASYSVGSSADLYRSEDGGRRWTRVASFVAITALEVDASSASTLYLGATRAGSLAGIFKSVDGGSTWTQTLLDAQLNVNVTAFTASPSEDSTLYATAFDNIYRSEDAGTSWAKITGPALGEVIASLLIDPTNAQVLYAGGYAFDYPSYTPLAPFFKKSSDRGATWTDLSEGLCCAGFAQSIAVDPTDASTIFVGLGRTPGDGQRGVRKSADGGATWSASGLSDATVWSVAIDPQDPNTLYAATDSGVHRSRDGGATWVPIGQQLAGSVVRSLSFDAGGRILHAATERGTFTLEVAAGAIDVSSRTADADRVLFWDGDRLAIRTRVPSGDWTSSAFEGPFSGWTATGIADGPDGLSRILWQHGDGRVGLEIAGAAGSVAAFRYAPQTDWTAADVSVDESGIAHLLWTSESGTARVDAVDSSGVTLRGPTYGPFGGWSAIAIADGSDGASWVLWRRTDGTAGISEVRSGALGSAFRWPAAPGWTVQDLTVARDESLRLLWTNPDGRMMLSSVSPEDGMRSDERTYSSPGLQARRIAASADGLTRVLWRAADGAGSLWRFGADNALATESAIPAPEPVSVSGGWRGTFDSADLIDCDPGSAAEATFNQNGASVDGTLEAINACGFTNAAFQGTLLGTRLLGSVAGDRFTNATAAGNLFGDRLEITVTNGFGLIPGGAMHLRR